jgi:hypothetical protein
VGSAAEPFGRSTVNVALNRRSSRDDAANDVAFARREREQRRHGCYADFISIDWQEKKYSNREREKRERK